MKRSTPYTNVCGVCYSQGCTVARTDCGMLEPYDRDKFPDLVPDMRIGFHRFDDDCPEYDSAVCFGCKQSKVVRDVRG